MLHFAKDFDTVEQMLGYIRLKNKPTPVLDMFRSNGINLVGETINFNEYFSILQDGKLAVALDNSSLTMTVNADLAKFLSKGHIINIDDEYFAVDSVNTSTNVVTVKSRGYASTPISAHLINSIVYVISKAEGDGLVTQDFKKSNKLKRTNVMQEFTKTIEITKRALNVSQKDLSDLKADETTAKIGEQGEEMDRSVLYGIAKYDDGDEARHTMGGLKSIIISHGGQVLDAENVLNDDKFDYFLAQLAQKGSECDTIIVNPLAMNKVFKALRNTITFNKDQQGNQTVGGVITGYMPTTMGGRQLKFVLDVNCRATDLFVVDSTKLFFIPMVDKETGKQIVLVKYIETNTNSAVYNASIKTVGTIKVEQAHLMGYIANIF